jgi:two-component system, NtrC family, response regulator
MARILIIDRDKTFEMLIGEWLENEGHEIRVDPDLDTGFETIQEIEPDLVIIGLPEPETESTHEVVEEYLARSVSYKVIITTNHPIERARVTRFIQMGAVDFFTKPLRMNENFMAEDKLKKRVISTVSHALSQTRSEASLADHFKRGGIIGKSSLLTSCLSALEKAAKTDDPILIIGETGTGKELFARAAHENSSRSRMRFEALNCAAIPESLAESELFGYEEGAHDTARKKKEGLVKLADRGTLFLDEIGDLPLSIQAKLLRCLQEKTFLPLGATKLEKANFRLVSATNKDLKEKVDKGEFRRDFYYRIETFTIHLPPLKDRREDINDLASHFIDRICKKMNIRRKTSTKGFIDALESYNWPGNVRELESILSSAISKAGDISTLDPYHLPPQILGSWLASQGHVVHEASVDDRVSSVFAKIREDERRKNLLGKIRSSILGNDEVVDERETSYNSLPKGPVDLVSVSLSDKEGTITYTPGIHESPVEITPENVIMGVLTWKQIQKLHYHARVALMVAAKSLWKKPQKELAEVLSVTQNAFERFFSTAKKKAQKGDINIEDLKPHVSEEYHPALEEFQTEALTRNSSDLSIPK